MASRIRIIYRIITAVSVKIKSVRIFGINILGTIRRDKSTPNRRIISRVEVVKLGFYIIVISSIAYRIRSCDNLICSSTRNSAVTPCIVIISYHSAVAGVIYLYDIPPQVSAIVIRRSNTCRGVFKPYYSTLIIEVFYLSSNHALWAEIYHTNFILKVFLPKRGISYFSSSSGPQECEPTPRIARSRQSVTLSLSGSSKSCIAPMISVVV